MVEKIKVKWLTRMSRVRDFESPNGPVKLYTALQTVRHRFNIYASSCVVLALVSGHLPEK